MRYHIKAGIVAAALLAVLTFGSEAKKPKNIILLIGDGMGLEQVSCAWVANKGSLNIDKMPVVGFHRTYSANKLITDSGAGGTALACGEKTNYRSVGVDVNGKDLESVLAAAHKKGMKTGVAVTCRLSDATPADFCAHNVNRGETDDIVADYLESGADFIAGGGRSEFTNRKDGRNILEEFAAKGYAVCDEVDELAQTQSLPVIATVAESDMEEAALRGDSFQRIVEKGIKLLSEGGRKGFFLMIEGSRIDDYCHSHDIDKAVAEMLDFDKAVGQALDFARKDGNTLVVVTADHSTGGLTLLGGDLKAGELKVNFSTNGHNGIAVPYYVYGAGAENFGGILENADIGAKLKALL